MKDVKELDVESILDDSVFVELFGLEDPIEKSRRKVQLQNRAKTLGVKTDFDEIIFNIKNSFAR